MVMITQHTEDLSFPKKAKLNILTMEGLAIFSVILVHSGTPNSIYSFFSYGLSSLIFARGYQWKAKDFKQVLSSRIQLLITYYFAGFINTLIFLLLAPKNFITTSKWKYFFNFLTGRLDKLSEIPINVVPLWFFLMLFFAETLYAILYKNTYLLYIFSIFAVILRIIPHAPLPFKLDTALCSIPFFLIGKKWKEKNYDISFLTFLLSFVGLVVISQYNGDISWNTQWFGKNGLIAFLGEILAVLIIIYLSSVVRQLRLDSFFNKLALNSLFIISYHFLFGTLLYFPFTLVFGKINDPMPLLHKYWYIHFALNLTLIMLAIKYLPRKIRNFLVGGFRFIK
ncbi:MAG: hypothetical protein ACP5KD_03650 [Fervidobacterium sp.]|jgi:hypothetical protein